MKAIPKEEAMILYKVLNKDLLSPYQSFQYEIGKKYHCKDFNEDKDNTCSSGFYATDLEGLPYAYRIHKKVYKCKVWGKAVEIDEFKRRYEYIELLEEVAQDELYKLCKPLDKILGYKLSEVIKPINPFELPKKKLTEKHKELLKEWAMVYNSVWASVWASVRDSVYNSVYGSVYNSVWASVRASVYNLVYNSVRVYISSLFPNIKKWEGFNTKGNPFQSCIDLWKDGFVPSFDGKTWRLHQGKDAKIVYEYEV